jgi:hypothetical protein
MGLNGSNPPPAFIKDKKWELAERIFGSSEDSEQILYPLFQGIMDGIEVEINKKLDVSMKKRIWDQVSKEKLKTVSESFIVECQEKVIGCFKDDEVIEMLNEYTQTGAIKFSENSIKMQEIFGLKQESIIKAVIQKVQSTAGEWIPEIVEALNREGIKFPIN